MILNKTDYIGEGSRQLNNGIHYKKIESIDVKRTHKFVQNQIATIYNTNEINKVTFDYRYIPFTVPNTPYIYLLPKIHKISATISHMDPFKKDAHVEIKGPGRPTMRR